MKKIYLVVTMALVLLLSQTAQAAETCEKYGTISVEGGEYIIQNNCWGTDARQCVESTGGTGFRVSVSELNQGSVGSYPSIFKGCHWDVCTSGSGLPVKNGGGSFSFSVSSNRPSGDYNVAAEAWLSPDSDCSGGYSGGAEIMVVLDYQNMYPAGSQVGTYSGHDVYYNDSGWDFFTYVKTGRSSASGNIGDFINDAASRSERKRDIGSMYLHDMEAGFEIMRGGQGLTCNSFSFSPSGGGPGTTTTTTAATTTTTAATTTTTAATTTTTTSGWWWGWTTTTTAATTTTTAATTTTTAETTTTTTSGWWWGWTTTTTAATTTTAGTTTTTAATTSTTAGDGCDCGTCNWYGTSVPMCCESCSGWGWYDGGCQRSCVCQSTCDSQ